VKRATAAAAHRIPDRAPLRLEVGDDVEVGERDSEWPEFVFVTAPHGEGWVPARHLSATSGRARVTHAYDTTELRTEPGDALEIMVEDRISGWLWCRSAAGREGWVPANTVQEDD